MSQEKLWIPVIQRRGESLLMTSYLMTAYQDQYHQEILRVPRGVYYTKYLDGLVIIEASDMSAFAGAIAERITPSYLSYFTSRCRFECQRLLAGANMIRSTGNHSAQSNAALAVSFSGYSSDVIRLMPFLFGLVTMERILEEDLEKRLERHVASAAASADVGALMHALTFPSEKNIPSQALVDLFQLASDVNANAALAETLSSDSSADLEEMRKLYPTFMSALNDYLEKYDFMDMEYYNGSPLEAAELLERVRDVIPGVDDRLARIRADQARIEDDFGRACERAALPPDLLDYIDVIKEVHFLRQHRADALFRAGRDVVPFLCAVAERLGLDYESLICLTWQEICDSLITEELTVSAREISARRTGYGILLIDGQLKFITGRELDAELAALPERGRDADELDGDVAFPGKYEGRVVIVTTHDEIAKVAQGDVLVSPSTDPYYVPAMVKAGAIVTDEGGILSHAAIVSRELGIPCVIGTGLATAVLRDGDAVVVDATGERGSVRRVGTQA